MTCTTTSKQHDKPLKGFRVALQFYPKLRYEVFPYPDRFTIHTLVDPPLRRFCSAECSYIFRLGVEK